MRQANHQNHIPLTFIIILLGLGACDDDPEKDVMNTLPVDMMLSGGNNAGEVMAGEVMAGEVMAGGEMAGEVMAGEEMAGEVMAGEVMAGEVMAGEEMAGEEMAGEEMAGEEMAGAEASLSWHMLSFRWEHGCGLTSEGEISCWGRNQQGQAQPNHIDQLAIESKSVSVGRYHSCFEGTLTSTEESQDEGEQARSHIQCWGRDVEGQLTPPTDIALSHVSAGWRETCALDEDGHPHCWGELDPEQLPSVNLSLSTIKLSQGFGCGIDAEDASIHCWGRNEYRQATPPSGIGYSALSVGTGRHSCALSSDQLARCWGDSSDGKTLPPAISLKEISVGRNHTCAITREDEITCWGVNTHGQTRAPAGRFQWVSSGPTFSCGLRVEGTLSCWGALNPPSTPLFSQVSVGLSHTCALKVDQSLSCWGWPRAGRTLPPLGTYLYVTTGDEHSCAVSTEGQVHCWGVGIDPTRFERDGDFDQASPPPISEPVQMVSAGARHTCALTMSGHVVCWGSNQYGQSTPSMLTWPAVQLTSGRSHSCARSADGQVACWGDDRMNQQSIPDTETFIQIDAGGDGTCGQKADYTLACWGGPELNPSIEAVNTFALGDQTLCFQRIQVPDDATPPETVCDTPSALHSSNTTSPWRFTLSDVALNSIDAGMGYACALRADERVTCVGNHAPLPRPK